MCPKRAGSHRFADTLLLLGRIACGLLLPMSHLAWFICLSLCVYLSVGHEREPCEPGNLIKTLNGGGGQETTYKTEVHIGQYEGIYGGGDANRRHFYCSKLSSLFSLLDRFGRVRRLFLKTFFIALWA